MINQDLCGYLANRGVPFALIGAVALAVHGAARFTADVDLLTLDEAVLERGFWAPFPGPALEGAVSMGSLPCPVVNPLALLKAQAFLDDRGLASRFRELLPSLGKDARRFVDRFRILDGLA